MATPTTSVTDFCTLIAKSKLLPAEEVEAVASRWRAETGAADDQVGKFRRYLIARGYLTDWQAHMVQRGRAEGFFIGGYKILDRIGKGQMGGVYKAVHTLGQLVALKVLPSSRAKDPHTLGRFQREARLLTQLDHPNVVRAFQFGEANGVHYISMEYLEGETLDEVLARRGRLPWGEAVRLIHQAFSGLQHLHEKRMVHRDLKPANLMLTPEPSPGSDTTWDATVKVLDIGLGRMLFADDTPEGQIETQLTVEGSVLGTPDYLAPEQAKDAASADIRADIYSLGCVLYHCLAGRPPFPETNIMAQMLLHAMEKPAPLASSAPDAPSALQGVIDRMLAKSPDDRYQTPAAAAEALRPFLGSGGSAPAATAMVPAYKAWLESESQLEVVGKLPPAPGMPAKPAAPAAAPAVPAKPATAAPPAPSSPVKPPSPRPAPARPAPSAATVPTPKPVGTPPLRQPPAVRPIPAPPPRPVEEEVEVELVLETAPAPVFVPPPAPVVIPDRPLWDLDRRDWIMLAMGATGVLAAVGLGYGLARVARKKPEEVPPEEGQ
jgi:serine/threonine protein kinase